MKWLALVATLAFARPVLADSKRDADALFKQGKKLAAEKQYAEACAAFEKSDALDPGIGAKLNIARCYEEWGRLARAHEWYTAAEKMAADARDDRLPKIRELLATLDPEVPRVTVNVPVGADLAAAAIQLDGKPLAASALGKPLRVDPGPHELVYLVDGARMTKMLPMERGSERELTLDIPLAMAADDAPPSAAGRTRKFIGLSVGAAGVVGIGIATYLTLDARGTYKDALDEHCMGSTNLCNAEGLSITADARSQANVGTVITLISLATVAGGVVLYLTAPKADASPRERGAVYVVPVAGERSAGLVFGGGF